MGAQQTAVVRQPRRPRCRPCQIRDGALLRRGAHRSRNALLGMIWARRLPHDRRVLLLARFALTGFLKEAPPRSRDPMHWAAAVALATALLKENRLLAILAAAALIVAFDARLRARHSTSTAWCLRRVLGSRRGGSSSPETTQRSSCRPRRSRTMTRCSSEPSRQSAPS